jgi:hypothetical protein
MRSEFSLQPATGWLMKNGPDELESQRETIRYQSASIKAAIAIGMTFLEIARIGGERRREAKEKAERTVEAVRTLLQSIGNRLETADRELIQTRLAELESAIKTFDDPPTLEQ